MNYQEASKLPRSEKVSLVIARASKLVKVFDVHSFNIYKRQTPFFVENVRLDGLLFEEGTDKGTLLEGQFKYYPEESTVYIYSLTPPEQNNFSLDYKLFFSNAPLILPHDLNNGESVEWMPLVDSIGNIGQVLDDENTGIVLESQSSVSLINNDGFFDSIFDTLIWENKPITFYSWFPGTPISEARNIFEGVIESKDFSGNNVVFRVKDLIFRLRDKVNLGVFSENDGNPLPSLIGKAKRRIFGRVDKCQAAAIDCVIDGYELTGTSSISATSPTVTGVGTLYLSEVFSGDEIVFFFADEEYKYTVESVASNTSLRLTDESEITLTAQKPILSPERPWRERNRRWHLAGHELSESQAVITQVINARTFIVDNTSDFQQGDVVTINGTKTAIDRLSGSQIILEQSIFPIPLIDNIIFKDPVLAAYYGNRRLIPGRDFTLSNAGEAIIEIDPLAEFNIAKERLSGVSGSNGFTLTFTNGSRNVNTTATVDLRTILKPKDWIRPVTQSTPTWFEVSSVYERTVVLVSNYNTTTRTDYARIKNVDIIGDESLITVDCYGIAHEGRWVKTASQAVKQLIKEDAGFLVVNEDSFSQAESDCRYTISMVVPDGIGDDLPLIRDVITKINQSVFGSLYGNSSSLVSYSIVNTRRPSDLSIIRDDDIISWESDSSNTIVNKTIVFFRPFIDTSNGSPSFLVEEFDSDFVNKYVKIKNTRELTCYLYDRSAAETMAQRIAFYNSLSSLKLTIKGKALFFDYAVNDRLYLELDRLFKRYGSSSNKKIGIVSSVKKGQYDSEIVVNDMGNIFNRCPSIAISGTTSFSTASDDDKVKYGFILDSETLTPDITSEDELGNCLIG